MHDEKNKFDFASVIANEYKELGGATLNIFFIIKCNFEKLLMGKSAQF